ncbi:MAG: hypothetical protein HY741_09945 [Chloroflexi bacterium]|nr:hypothetical protein [Chloroflexota bacterium]
MLLPVRPNREPITLAKMRFKIVPNLPEHDVVYSVATGRDGKIYMGVSSEFGGAVHAHFMSYDPKTDQLRDIADLEKCLPEGKDRLRPPHAKIHTSMMAHPDGRIFWISHVTPPIAGEKAHRIYEIFGDPERGYLGSCVFVYDPRTDAAQNLGRLYPFCGTRFATLNPERDEIYTVSYPTTHFTVFRIRTGESVDLGRISQNDAIGPCWSAQGCAYTTDDDGYMIRYDPAKEELERLPVRIPSPPGHMGHGNRVRRVKVGPDGVKLYGITGLSCHLYEYDPTAGRCGQMRDIGLLMGEEKFEAPNNVPQGKALTFGNDGQIYVALNVSGEIEGPEPAVHIVRVDPGALDGEDYGRMEIAGMLPLHAVQDACTDLDGNIYFAVAMPEPPTFLAAFHPSGLPQNIAKNLEREAAPYRLAPAQLAERKHALAARVKAKNVYWFEREWAFVSQGTVIMHDLGFEGYMPPIPPGECAITALALGPHRRLYGATSGKKSHLFVYRVEAHQARTLAYPIDLGVLNFDGVEQTGCAALIEGIDGCIYGGTSAGILFRHNPGTEVPIALPEFTYFPHPFDGTQIEDLGTPIAGEGIQALVANPARGLIYGLTPGGTLFSFDPKSRAVEKLARLEGPCVSHTLLCDPAGNLYGSMGEGQLFQYRTAEARLRVLPDLIPCGKGRAYLNAMTACVWGRDGIAYAGTSADGVLFAMEFQDEDVKIRSLGKPTWSGHIRALIAGHDGIIYGIAGRADVFSRLFCFDPKTRELRDLGILQASLVRPWVGQRFDAMAAGPNGEIFLGESDRISHLFVYYPPVH